MVVLYSSLILQGYERPPRDTIDCFIKPQFKILSEFLLFTLIFGVILVPILAHAGLLSAIFADEAKAAGEAVVSSDNSQTMTLLQANISAAPVFKGKTTTNKEKEVKEEPVLATGGSAFAYNIASENALVPTAAPVAEDDEPVYTEEETSVYVVRKGDSWAQIAQMYDVTVNTILWANDKKKGDKLVEGEILFIPPVSGLEHEVKSGQTCQSIAKLYKVDASEIADYNGMSAGCKLVVGEKIFVPGGQKAENDKPVKNLSASIAKDNKFYESHPTKNLNGYYVNPVPGYRKSQGVHDNNGVDMAIRTGTPIRAAASGKVILARNGYNGGYGNLVIIKHPNGTETLYAHQSKISTSTGAQVSQGEVIGYVGSTGRSTGPHLHFEVHGARNPGADNSWAD